MWPKLKLPHHGYIGILIMGIGLYLETLTWDASGNFQNPIPFLDVISWVVAFAGFGLWLSDFIEHFIKKEKHTSDLDRIEK